MTWSSAKPGRVHAAAALGAAVAAWAPEELGEELGVRSADCGPTAPVGHSAPGLPGAGGPQSAPRAPHSLVAELEARLAAAQAEADALRAEFEGALADAHATGYAAGERAERARLHGAVTAADAALDALRAGEQRWTGAIEENICAMAVAIAHHLIGREPATDPTAVVELVRRATREFAVDQPLVVRVSPADLAAIEQAGDALAPLPAEGARWVADPRVASGGCLVEGRERIVDGRVDTGLERVYRRLSGTNA